MNKTKLIAIILSITVLATLMFAGCSFVQKEPTGDDVTTASTEKNTEAQDTTDGESSHKKTVIVYKTQDNKAEDFTTVKTTAKKTTTKKPTTIKKITTTKKTAAKTTYATAGGDNTGYSDSEGIWSPRY